MYAIRILWWFRGWWGWRWWYFVIHGFHINRGSVGVGVGVGGVAVNFVILILILYRMKDIKDT